jgi:hemolysin-activating ACP:hemolysin acyltransferase
MQLPVAVRSTDPPTCKEPTNRNAQAARLLDAYCLYDLTDEEAVEVILGGPATLSDEGLRRRASDLRALGWIAPTGDSRPNRNGRRRMVCAITGKGRDAHMRLFVNDQP